MACITRRTPGLVAAIVLGLSGTAATAQDFPARTIRYVVPFAPGGVTDYTGRLLAPHLSQALGQSVVVENRPGGGGVTGVDAVVRSPADGYTIVQMDPSIVINPTLMPSVPYDIFKQLTAVSIISSSPLVLVTAPQLKTASVADFIAFGKANPGKLNFSSAGIGTTPHLAAELYKQRTGIDAQHVPYKGIGQSFPDMMNNKIQFAFSSIAGAQPFTADNRIIALATTGAQRSKAMPQLPTMAESGLANYAVDLWLAIYAPGATPAPVVEKLNAALVAVLKKDEVIKGLEKVGAEPKGTTAAEAARFTQAEFDLWKKVVVDGKIKVE